MQHGELLGDVQRTSFILIADRETALRDCLSFFCQLQEQPALPRWILHRLGTTEQTLERLVAGDRKYILYIQYDREEIPSLCTASRKTPEQLHNALWERKIPAILTSGTLMAGGNFDRTIQRLELFPKGQIKEYTADFVEKKVKKNRGEVRQYYIANNHPAIIPRDIFQQVQLEIARRSSKSCLIKGRKIARLLSC